MVVIVCIITDFGAIEDSHSLRSNFPEIAEVSCIWWKTFICCTVSICETATCQSFSIVHYNTPHSSKFAHKKMRTLSWVRETLKSKKYNTNTIVVHYFLTIVPPLDSRVGWWTANKKTFHFNPTLAFEQSKASLIFAKLYNYIAKASGVQIRWFFAHLTVIRYQQMQICRFFLFIIF